MPLFDIATMGTSLTAGNAVSRSWHRDLRQALMSAGEIEVTTYNFGVGGADINQGLSLVEQVSAIRPRAVTIEYSANDCQIPFQTAKSKTKELIAGLRTRCSQSEIFLLIMNPVVGSGPSASGRPLLPQFQQMYRDLSVSEDVGLIDSASMWAGVTLAEIPDGIHPLPESNRVRLIPALAAALGPRVV